MTLFWALGHTHMRSNRRNRCISPACAVQLLADGICQQRLLYELLVPLHQQWLRNDDSVASISSWCAADDNSRGELVDMVASCNPIVAALLKVWVCVCVCGCVFVQESRH